MPRYRIEIDRSLCSGMASCVKIAPDTFDLDPDGLAILAGDRRRPRGRGGRVLPVRRDSCVRPGERSPRRLASGTCYAALVGAIAAAAAAAAILLNLTLLGYAQPRNDPVGKLSPRAVLTPGRIAPPAPVHVRVHGDGAEPDD